MENNEYPLTSGQNFVLFPSPRHDVRRIKRYNSRGGNSVVQERVSNPSGRLSVIMAALLIFALIVPTGLKLDALQLSDYLFKAESTDPACVPSSYCLHVRGGRFE